MATAGECQGPQAVLAQAAGGHGAAEPLDLDGFGKALADWCRPFRLDVSRPFLAGWYNDKRATVASKAGNQLGSKQGIDAIDGALCFALYSVPGFIDTVAEYFGRVQEEKANPRTDYVDACTDSILVQLKQILPPRLDALIVNTDTGPPYYHVQTIGAIAGIDQHIELQDLAGEAAECEQDWQAELEDQLEHRRDPKMWGTDPVGRRKIFGVNVHPKYGGWYAYRGLLVLRGIDAHADGALVEAPPVRAEPLCFVKQPEMRRILKEYNLQHELCLWREIFGPNGEDLLGPEMRYGPEEYLFFNETNGQKRRRFLELRYAQMKKAASA
eukprot:gnl/TRDRNA2_/TRDRNA2_43371_c0_seq1.p1 gnl/TRDRNA2_/TRDRNA2_43371_c0~~gnl/TRDRNA2_/TRDRNA2_43371_c0_seq1.p1  ORF type:complete len:340 (-),score=66.05 gnl/TRDRNA2_/TRDRNA2_43371_c0_seq1:72-1052(-)